MYINPIDKMTKRLRNALLAFSIVSWVGSVLLGIQFYRAKQIIKEQEAEVRLARIAVQNAMGKVAQAEQELTNCGGSLNQAADFTSQLAACQFQLRASELVQKRVREGLLRQVKNSHDQRQQALVRMVLKMLL